MTRRTTLITLLGTLCLWTTSCSDDFKDENTANATLELFGTVVNQDGQPVAGAEVILWEDRTQSKGTGTNRTTTDSQGKYSLSLNKSNNVFGAVEVKASGYASFCDYNPSPIVQDTREDFTLTSRVIFKAERISSIILPYNPDAKAGKYYKLKGLEERNRLVFERELLPQANIPYLLIAEKDYALEVASQDLSAEPAIVTADIAIDNPNEWGLAAYVERKDVVFFRGSYKDIVTLPDPNCYPYMVGDASGCRLMLRDNETVVVAGAFRAFLEVHFKSVNVNELRLELVDNDGSKTFNDF